LVPQHHWTDDGKGIWLLRSSTLLKYTLADVAHPGVIKGKLTYPVKQLKVESAAAAAAVDLLNLATTTLDRVCDHQPPTSHKLIVPHT